MTSNQSTFFRLAVMTTKSQEIERARKELELLKDKERSLAAKLALLNKNEDNQNGYTEQYLTNSIMDEPIPVKNGLTNQNIFQSLLMNGDFKESSVDEISDNEDIEPKKEAVPTIFTNTYKNIELFPDEDDFQNQKNEDFFGEDEKLDDFQFSITNNSQLNFSHSEEELFLENEDDLETKSTSPVDHRNDIFQDIYEAKAREKALKIERGMLVESDQSSSETESEKELQIEDSRDRIVREIEEEKLRELELQAKYKGRGILLNRTFEEPEKTQLKDSIETRQLITIEINDFKQREEELRTQWSKLNRTKKKKDDEDLYINSMHDEPRHYVENGNYEEKMIIQELIKLENILHNKNENEVTEERETNHSKGKIFQEIEELLYRELELKERSQGIQTKQMELQTKKKLEDEQQKHQARKKTNIEGQMNSKIWQEIIELQRREENLKREYAKIQHKKLQMNNMLNGISLLHLNDSEMRSLDVEKLNFKDKELFADKVKAKDDKDDRISIKNQPSRDKVVKVNSSNIDKDQTNQLVKKTTNNVNQSGILKDGNQGNQSSQTKDGYSNKPSRAKDIQVNKISRQKLFNFEQIKMRKIILDSEISNNLVSQDVKVEENIQKYEKPYVHDLSILPITTKWENKAEEERNKQLVIQREIQSKRDSKIQMMRIKAEQERLRQEEQQILDLEKQRVIKNRYLLKLKKQGLNDLWAAKKPLVTLEYNEDRNDLYLLDNTFMPIKVNNPVLLTLPTATSTPPTTTSTPTSSTPTMITPITLTKTIMKWEKRIKKNTSQNISFT